MKKILIFGTFLILKILVVNAQTKPIIEYQLGTAIDEAVQNSLSSKLAQSVKESKHIQYNLFKSGLGPELDLTGNPINFSRDYFGVIQPDGTLVFQPRTQNYSNFNLNLSQQIGLTGGAVSISSAINRFDDFNLNQKQYSGIPVALQVNQPLFAFNGYTWNKKIELLKRNESDQQYIRDIENISLETANLYFNVLEAQADFDLAMKNQENQNIIFDIEKKRIALGTTNKEKILQIELQLLNLKQEILRASMSIKSSIFDLKSYVGIKDTLALRLTLPETLPQYHITTEEAIVKVKNNRAEFIGYIRRKLEAERDLDEAKRQRYAVNVNAGFGLNTIGTNLVSVYHSPTSSQNLVVGITIPILDWGRNKYKVSSAKANLKILAYTIDQEEILITKEVTNLLESINVTRDGIAIAKQADEIAQERYDLAILQFRFGKVTVTDLNIAFSERDNAKRAYIVALKNYWISYFTLRSLTLYDGK
ncbi:TolC family protein [Mucilaginibacter sp. BJC16-A38]|uniref:TolC family protein n=1 Tax=Mucilaginibacter phenanthrenivorans TaxID=1234842 RepID=UPI0021582012|nr:TolC family protein [Mucilaginibacter phenanthrenivorans]MCR8561066.1 TolC family protein [Mucilaginibacter phenanthrenivorans]